MQLFWSQKQCAVLKKVIEIYRKEEQKFSIYKFLITDYFPFIYLFLKNFTQFNNIFLMYFHVELSNEFSNIFNNFFIWKESLSVVPRNFFKTVFLLVLFCCSNFLKNRLIETRFGYIADTNSMFPFQNCH